MNDNPAAPPNGARYRIGAVSRLSGLSQHTIRVWERRYGVLDPSRSAGGNRLYTEDDVAHLRHLKALVDQGHAIGTIAHLSFQELEAMLATYHTPASLAQVSLEAVRERFLAAVGALNMTEADQVLGRAVASLAPRELVHEVLLPLLQELGERWEQGRLRVAHEHLASVLLRNQLTPMMRMHVPLGRAPRTIVATPPGEMHEFGALLAALLAVANGWEVLYLGPNLPADDLAYAAREIGARAVLLSCVMPVQGAAEADLLRLRHALPQETALVLGGGGAADLLMPEGAVFQVSGLTGLEPLLQQLGGAYR